MEDLEMCSTERNDRAWSAQMRKWVVEVNEKVSKMEIITKEVSSLDPRGTTIHIIDGYSNRTPNIVSFGPCYNGGSFGKQTQKMKELVLLWSLKIQNKRLDDYVAALWEEVPHLKEVYDRPESRWPVGDNDAFLRMMILDGFFLVEILRQASEWFQDDPDYFLSNREEANHPAWSVRWMGINELREHYRYDMLLLKNQLPLGVLYKIEAVNSGLKFTEATRNINKWIIRFVWSFPWAPRTLGGEFNNVHHLYRGSLLHQECTGKNKWKRVKSMMSCFPSKTPSATKFEFNIPLAKEFLFDIPLVTELCQEGFSFTTSKATTLMDVSFGGRTLRLPQIYVDYYTKIVLLNISNYERKARYRSEITSYTYFLSRLVKHEDDVKYLQRCGIILSTLSCEKND